MEESPRILRFNEIPSAEEFTSQIEPKNVPVVLNGCVKDWKAVSMWNVSNGGLDYLLEMGGSAVVEAMLSRSAPVFYGDIRSHERVTTLVPLPFSTFVGYCKDLLQYGDDGQDSQLRKCQLEGLATQNDNSLAREGAPQQIYLAQVPIVNTENEEKIQLECLREDIEMPAFLEGKMMTSVNLWMNNARSRSSTHYDPYHNLLCIISGCKQVVLWPPSASPLLYPLSIYGESSNHSAIALENPNFRLYPRAKCLDEYSQKVILQAGDALFIPEGWFHQVDSESVTIAVNFWWRSEMVSGQEQMLCMHSTAVDKKMIYASAEPSHGNADSFTFIHNCYLFSEHNVNKSDNCDKELDQNHQTVRSTGKTLEQRFMLHELEPHALHSLQELVSLVHERVNQSQSISTDSEDPSVSQEEVEVTKSVKTNFLNLKEDPIAYIVWTLEPHAFQSVFLAMAHNFPRTLEAFILHALSPVGTEVLTRKFEQMDQMIVADDRSQFYEKFYSVFDNESSAMDALLNGKESFARQALNNVLDQYLGINFDGPKPLVE
ncbi:hypothetical protein ACJIZ3_016795 [Penstemon smallii]|uniref:JmjC domain-containing protein n=1 Tax=Penstemon smallii TaxID=265156 RepID=A0ABD3SU36_9LAMI